MPHPSPSLPPSQAPDSLPHPLPPSQAADRFRIGGELFRQLYEKVGADQSLDKPQRCVLCGRVELAGDDGDGGNGVQLLEELESIRVLQLEVDPKHNDLEEGMEDTPRLGLEHGRDQVSWGEGERECMCVWGGGGSGGCLH